MAEGILGLGSGQAASLNQELIDKLKAAEKRAKVEPIEKDLEAIPKEREIFKNIQTKVDELLAAIKPFNLFLSEGSNAFEQKAANTSGDSVTFDAVDVSKLSTGVTSVNIQALAQRDVYQSDKITEANKNTLPSGNLSIKVGSETHTFAMADYNSYEDLAKAIDNKAGIKASFDKIGTDGSGNAEYRLVLKSENSGIDNKLEISGTAADDLGYTTDELGTVKTSNHLLTAQDMTALVDGVSYSVAENTLEVDGLKISAKKIGESSINISEDKTKVETQMQTFVTKYNELFSLINAEQFNVSSEITDKSALRNVVSQIKDKLFGTYGDNSDKSIFNFGFELDKNGLLSLDSKEFKKAVENNFNDLKNMFIGSAEKEGLGTQLKTTLDTMKLSGGILNSYDDSIDSREKNLKKDKDKAQEELDDKYKQLASQFGSYSAIITRYEAQFSGLKLMIQQSTS